MGIPSNSPARALAPVPGASGRFDPDTASLYDMFRRVGPDGQVVYHIVYVDAAGRTLATDRPANELTQDERVAAQVFEMGHQNPNLRILIDSVRRYAEQQGADKVPSPPADPP